MFSRGWMLVLTGVLVGISCTTGPPEAQPTTPSPTVTEQPGDASRTPTETPRPRPTYEAFAVPAGARPHDVAPAPDGRVWYTAQGAGALGRLNPRNGNTRHVRLGAGSRPHGVIVGPDGAAWVTDSGLNAIVRVDPDDRSVTTFPLPRANANLNTAAFDAEGTLWFTGQAGIYGSVDPSSGRVRVYDAPRGTGPYGIDATPDGVVWYSSLAGSYIARIRSSDGNLRVVDVPTRGGGARRVWSDSRGRLWVTQWFAGKLARYNPANDRWREWDKPGNDPQPYAVFVDDEDMVWVTDFGSNALVRFNPSTQRFRSFRLPSANAQVRQLLGVPGEVWGAGSATDELFVLRTR